MPDAPAPRLSDAGSEVTRYKQTAFGMEPSPTGDWVAAAELAALKGERDEARAEAGRGVGERFGFAAEAAFAERRSDATEAALGESTKFIRTLIEEFVNAGYPAGDRTVLLANVRTVLARLASLTGGVEMMADLVEQFHDAIVDNERERAPWSRMNLDHAKKSLIEALRARDAEALRAAPAEGMVSVPQSALDWLFGEGPDADGLHWGDDAYGDLSKRPYWWRSHFRKLLAASPSPAPAGLIAALETALRQWKMYAEMSVDDDTHDGRNIETEQTAEGELYRSARRALAARAPTGEET